MIIFKEQNKFLDELTWKYMHKKIPNPLTEN